tara:strand:+ start:904 stop:3096 length:2193 start_codon:yes stop_codon:yes gene_type:complete
MALTAAEKSELDQLESLVASLTADQKKVTEGERGIFGDVKAWMSGADKDPSIPVYGENIGVADFGFDKTLMGKGNLLHTAIVSSFDDNRLRASIAKVEPDAKFQLDDFGNLVAGMPIRNESGEITSYKKFYPNPKGFDAPTIGQVSQGAVMALPTTKATAAFGLPTKGYTGAATTGMVEAGLLEGISSQAADQPFRLAEIPSGAIGGMLGKGVLDIGSIAAKLAPEFLKNPQMFHSRRGEIDRALLDLGFDPEDVMAKLRDDVDRMVNAGLDPLESARKATAQSLPSPINLTAGQTTGVKSQQLFENAAAGGTYGPKAESRMNQRLNEQQEAIGQNVKAIQGTMAGDDLSIIRGEGAASAQGVLVAQRYAAEQGYKDAYKSAEAATAFTNPQHADEFNQSLTNSLRDFRDGVGGAPATFRLLDEAMIQLSDGASIQSLFDLRKAIVKQQMAGGVEAGAASALKRGLDDVLITQMDRNLLYGNPASVAKGLDAISKFKDFKNLWDNEGVLKTLTEQSMRDGVMVLKVDPKEAANKILGLGIAASTSKPNLMRDLVTMRKLLPVEEWNKIRQEAFIKLADTLETTGKVGPQASVQFNKAWRNLKKKHNTLAKLLFTKEEFAMIDSLASSSALIAQTEKNTSNSAISAAGMIQMLARSLGSKNPAKMMGEVKGLGMVVSMIGNMKMIPTLMGGMTPPSPNIPAGALGAMTTQGQESPIIQGIEEGARYTGAIQ